MMMMMMMMMASVEEIMMFVSLFLKACTAVPFVSLLMMKTPNYKTMGKIVGSFSLIFQKNYCTSNHLIN